MRTLEFIFATLFIFIVGITSTILISALFDKIL